MNTKDMEDQVQLGFTESGGYRIKAELSCISTLEDDAFIASCPSLQITSQGETLEESLKALEEALQLFIDYWGRQRKQLPKVLEELGWKLENDKLSIQMPKLKEKVRQTQLSLALA
jgi:predicted RNase H-like HicB family nuclease